MQRQTWCFLHGMVNIHMWDTLPYKWISMYNTYTIPHDFVFRSHNNQWLKNKRIQIDHGRPQTGFAISQRILLHFLIPDKRRYPYDHALMTSWSDPYGKEKPLSSPSQEIVDSDFGHLRILTVWEEEPSHFWPCQLWSITSPIFVEDGRKWGVCTAKRWVHCILPFFMPNLHEISPFSCLLSQIGCKHATINFEREKVLAKKGKSYGPITKIQQSP